MRAKRDTTTTTMLHAHSALWSSSELVAIHKPAGRRRANPAQSSARHTLDVPIAAPAAVLPLNGADTKNACVFPNANSVNTIVNFMTQPDDSIGSFTLYLAQQYGCWLCRAGTETADGGLI